MSGEEKMKLELQKVRDEFKMSENDCGSARVQSKYLTLYTCIIPENCDTHLKF
jgi:small subunit ribosomal protein S15